jgi:hypothetical protein
MRHQRTRGLYVLRARGRACVVPEWPAVARWHVNARTPNGSPAGSYVVGWARRAGRTAAPTCAGAVETTMHLYLHCAHPGCGYFRRSTRGGGHRRRGRSLGSQRWRRRGLRRSGGCCFGIHGLVGPRRAQSHACLGRFGGVGGLPPPLLQTPEGMPFPLPGASGVWWAQGM